MIKKICLTNWKMCENQTKPSHFKNLWWWDSIKLAVKKQNENPSYSLCVQKCLHYTFCWKKLWNSQGKKMHLSQLFHLKILTLGASKTPKLFCCVKIGSLGNSKNVDISPIPIIDFWNVLMVFIDFLFRLTNREGSKPLRHIHSWNKQISAKQCKR